MPDTLKENGKKKRKIVLLSCIAAGIGLAGILAGAVLAAGRNPLKKGLVELSEELTALEAERGEYFWTDWINQIGSENMQMEYSLNIGGIPELESMTVGIDGETKRDMAEKLFDTEVDISIANVRFAEALLSGTEDTIYLQVPKVWNGSIVWDTADLGGQWNDSALKKSMESLAGENLEIEPRIDVDLFRKFSVEPFSIADFLEENSDAMQDLYKNMEVTTVEKAKEEGMFSEAQADSLRDISLQNEEGETIETTCYLAVLPEAEMRRIFPETEGDIRLCVYLDSEKRIVRISTLPEEIFVTDFWKGKFAVNLAGAENVTDRVEAEINGAIDGLQTSEIEGTIAIEKQKGEPGSYRVEWDNALKQGEDVWDFSLEGSVKGENDRLSIDVENFLLKCSDEVICRGSGKTAFEPLEEQIKMPSGEEYRLADMNEWETALFLADCTKNVYDNYSGYLRLLQ